MRSSPEFTANPIGEFAQELVYLRVRELRQAGYLVFIVLLIVAVVVLVLWVVTLVLAPIISSILSMAVSRKREYLADATGAQFTRNPNALANALAKIQARPEATKAIARLRIPTTQSGPSGLKPNQVIARNPSLKRGVLALKRISFAPGICCTFVNLIAHLMGK